MVQQNQCPQWRRAT